MLELRELPLDHHMRLPNGSQIQIALIVKETLAVIAVFNCYDLPMYLRDFFHTRNLRNAHELWYVLSAIDHNNSGMPPLEQD